MNIAGLKSQIPWQLKIASKVVLARVPADYRLWRRLDLFRLGGMDAPGYAYRVFDQHFGRSPLAQRKPPFTCLEIGPGDSLFSALIAKARGSERTWLVDAGPFAIDDRVSYERMAAHLRELGYPFELPAGDLSEVLEACNARYLTGGLGSLAAIESGSVDLIWSQAVLEHIRAAEFLPFMRELHRVLRPDGVCSHRVDLTDHLGGKLNNLRFPESLWESEWMASSGFYTNRIRLHEMRALFEEAGFAVEMVGEQQWKSLPTPREKLASHYRSMSDRELLSQNFDVILRRA